MEQFEKNEKNKVVRGANRASYDKKTVFAILDAGLVCHTSFVMNDQPMIIPTAYGRDGETVYIHGSVKSRTMKQVKKGIPMCLSVTLLDGLVLARSAFHHSVNYRSVVLFGHAVEVEDEKEKNHALYLITENILKGRWDEVRPPSQKELDITTVLKFKIDVASAKIRSGDPVDEKSDHHLDIWAGVLPLKTGFDQPIPDALLREGIAVCESVKLA